MNYIYSFHKLIRLIVLLGFGIGQTACSDYLSKKPKQTLTVPSSLQDLKGLLDNVNAMNLANSPSLQEAGTDNYYIPNSGDLQTYDEVGNYNWTPTAYYYSDWVTPYTQSIYYANVVLDILSKISKNETNQATYNYVNGAALFFRAFTFYNLGQVFCKPYSSSSHSDIGIVLRLSPAIGDKVSRSTVQQTYERIITDLKTAAELLPDNTVNAYQPNKVAVFGALARVYLSMRDYTNAGEYADRALQLYNTLLDYNTVLTAPFFSSFTFYQVVNPERIFISTAYGNALLDQTIGVIDSILYRSYHNNDLRKIVFFTTSMDGLPRFKGSYYENTPSSCFTGLTTSELFLIRAECRARANNKDGALSDLNTLMEKRWKNDGSWVPYTATDAADALNKVLTERRKELIYRGQRLTDLRRFNLEGANITLKRIIDGVTYTLPPNDLRWVALIPPDEVDRSGIPQNAR